MQPLSDQIITKEATKGPNLALSTLPVQVTNLDPVLGGQREHAVPLESVNDDIAMSDEDNPLARIIP